MCANIQLADNKLEQDVLSELSSDPRIIAAHIGVMVNAGVVTLTGHVENLPDKLAVERAVGRVKGVRGIAEEIQVQLSTVTNQTDDQIAIGALNNLSWTNLIPENTVTVKVEKGWITLTGEVQSKEQKDTAAEIAHQQYGAVGVSNRITIAKTGKAAC